MADIQKIRVNIQTATDSGAGTDGDVYVGFAGREWHVDTSADDFEAGSSRTYVLGAGSNVLNAAVNDPRDPSVSFPLLESFPAYIRFNPRSRDDNWKLQRAVVTLEDQLFPMWDSSENIPQTQGIWLGIRSGLTVYLHNHDDIIIT